jgi:phosphoenolpyruvate phosphomutase
MFDQGAGIPQRQRSPWFGRDVTMRYATNDVRRARLRHLIATKDYIKIIEAHSPISAIIAENVSVATDPGSFVEEFDGLWSSSLTDSALYGLPDIEVLDTRTRLANIRDMFAVTTKPLIMDGDTGGQAEHFEFSVRDMELAGVSAVIIEDKTGLKRNSLLGTGVTQSSAEIDEFTEKIRRGKAAQVTDEFMIIARIESLILNLGMEHALHRADAYIEAGADGIMIHSRQVDPAEVLEFVEQFRSVHPTVTLISVPTTYNSIRADDLRRAGFNVIIYANHMFRAAVKAMQEVSREILRHGRTAEVEDRCVSLKEILHLSPIAPATPTETSTANGCEPPAHLESRSWR